MEAAISKKKNSVAFHVGLIRGKKTSKWVKFRTTSEKIVELRF